MATRAAYGQVIRGRRFDAGNPAAYLEARFATALRHPEYGPRLRELAQSPDSSGTARTSAGIQT
ncbi:hypothetical protein [Streptomyces sp. BE230]|uniref:hypothetical protein n=1 Tax=Streptomyces sp. BE230 TaxID=3002526 RepID=UPI003FA71035